jgi:chaperonin GroEL (HSP60 family)
MVKSCLGPNSSYKLIVCEDGTTYLASDSRTVFGKVRLRHPLAQVTAGAGVDVSRSTGGGSTTTIILISEILSSLLPLIRDGAKQSTLVAGCTLAYKKAREILDTLYLKPARPFDFIEDIISTSLCGTILHEHRSLFSKIVKDAVGFTKSYESRAPQHLDEIYIRTQVGGSIKESRAINGLALMREPIHATMRERLDNGKLLLVQGEFIVPLKGGTMYYEHIFRADSPEEYARLLRSKPRILVEIIEKVRMTGANVVLLEKGLEDYQVDLFARNGVIVIRRFPPPEWQHVISVTGAFPVSIFSATPSDIVTIGKVEYKRIGDSTWWFLEGFENPRGCEIFVRGPTTLFLQEAERLLKMSLKTLSLYLQEPKLVHGGGSVEFAIGEGLSKYAFDIPSKEQLVVQRIAESFLSIPKLLAMSADLDPIDSIIAIRTLSEQNKTYIYGIDGISKKVADVSKVPIVEALQIKRQCLKTVFETVITILRIDNVVQARELSMKEKHYAERQEKNSPEERRKRFKEAGIW